MLVAHFNGSFAGWRSEARRLLLAGAGPHEVNWQAGETGADLLTELATEPPRISATAPPRIPRELPELLETAARFRADDRWALLYRILWRVAHGDRTAMLAGDRDGSVLQRRIKSVHREAHHMHAFLRFRERTPEYGTPSFVAWHEPAHDILDIAAGHFAERLGRASWLIATPDAAALWDGAKMQILRPCPAELSQLARGTEDPGAELWLAYYGSTFNPARLNQDVLESNMPVRFWKDLPEGPLIPQLMSQARAGQQRLAQTASVGELTGKEVLIASDRAQPQRSSSTLLNNCRACTLWRDATCAVPGEGPNGARIMLIGDQPGDQEDLAGRPFIGTVGQVLQRALDHAKLSRDTLYLTHAVKHFKWQPGSGPLDRSSDRLGEAATQGEMEACRRWLVQELEQLAPRVIVALGKTALASLLKTYELPYMNMDDLLGRPFRHEELWVVVAPHPAAALNEDGGNQRFNELITALCQASQLAA